MAIPRILFAVPLLVAGAFLPAAGADPVKAPSGTVGMDHEVFTSDVVTIRRGQTLTLVNDSRWAHIIGPGRDGSLAEGDRNPMRERVLTETDDRYTTLPWNAPGTYYLTCSMHPDMTVKVVVTD
jgi:plastocyanin